MMRRLFLSALCLLLPVLWCAAAQEEKPAVCVTDIQGKYRVIGTTNRPGARAEIGDSITLKIDVRSREKGRFGVVFHVNGNAQNKEKFFNFGETAEFTVVAKTPGSVSAICTLIGSDRQFVRDWRKRKVIAGVGVLVSPDKIRPGNPDEPADFDAFWKKQRAELDKVPLNAERTEVEGDAKYPNVVCYDVKVACSGNAPVSGYLCMPRGAKPKSLPAVVTYHGAGVRSASKKFEFGTKAIAFDVNAHGLPNGRDAKFYRGVYDGPLKGYFYHGFRDDGEVCFIDMYKRVMRALDYVKSLPEWDGKTLIVHGGSQGGGQSIAAAGLDPQVTLCCPNVPALCDFGGRLLGRRPGWPMAYPDQKRQSDKAVLARTAYVDGVFFARRIKCPVYFSTGLIDNTCIASAVYAAFNSLPENIEKHIYVNPSGSHGTSSSKQGANEIRRQLGL